MADVTQTPANVHAYEGAIGRFVTLGESVVAGDWVFRNPTDNKRYKADCDNTVTTAKVEGMATEDGAVDDVIPIATGGPVDVGGTLTPGVLYVLSDNPGKMRPASDNGSGDYITQLGMAISASQLNVLIAAQGVALP